MGNLNKNRKRGYRETGILEQVRIAKSEINSIECPPLRRKIRVDGVKSP